MQPDPEPHENRSESDPVIEGSLAEEALGTDGKFFRGCLYLFFRPFAFFSALPATVPTGLFLLCVWTSGIGASIDGAELRFWMGGAKGRFNSWSIFWGRAAVAGLIGGVIWTYLFGWWYRIRLKWSGADDPDPALVRWVYVLANQVTALPILAWAAFGTLFYATPKAALEGDSWWDLTPFLYVPWSFWSCYAAARATFHVRRGAGIFWFILFPGGFVGFALTGLVALMYFSGPMLTNPLEHKSEGMTFRYPSNWQIDEKAEDYDPEANVSVEPIIQDAVLRFQIYESEVGLEEEMSKTLGSYRETIQDWVEEESFVPWARLRGLGRTVRGKIEGTSFTLRVFLGKTPQGNVLEIHELWEDASADKVLKGFDFIRENFHLGVRWQE